LQRENERLHKELAKKQREIAEKQQQIQDLERQLAANQRNSTNSSKPPSSDGSAGKPRPRGRAKKSRRKPGGQPVHETIAGVLEVLREQGREPDSNIQILDVAV
jgi:transposase